MVGRERTLLFLCGGSRWHPNEPWPQSLTHSLIYTRQYPHNLCHSTTLPSTTLRSYFQCVRTRGRAHTQHLQMSYLHHWCGQSWVTAIDTSHLTEAADHKRSMARIKMEKAWEREPPTRGQPRGATVNGYRDHSSYRWQCTYVHTFVDIYLLSVCTFLNKYRTW